MTQLDHLSYSAVTMYACPYRFQAHKLRGVPDIPGRAALVGGELHRLIAASLHADHPDAKMGDPDPRDIVPAAPDVADEAANMFADWQLADPLAGMRVLAIEWPIEIEFADLTCFRGRLDVVCEWQDTLVIYDWKSARYMPASLGNSPQMPTYALLADHEFGMGYADEVLVRQYYTRYNRYLEAQVSSIGRSNVYTTLAHFAQELAAADDSQDWPARPCESCVYCALDCPLPPVVVKPPQSAAQATQQAGRAIALESQAGASKAALRPWCDEHGPVTAAGRTFQINQPVKQVSSLGPRELVERFGDKAWDWLGVDHKRVGRSTAEDARVMVEEVGRQSFTSRKADTTNGGSDDGSR